MCGQPGPRVRASWTCYTFTLSVTAPPAGNNVSVKQRVDFDLNQGWIWKICVNQTVDVSSSSGWTEGFVQSRASFWCWKAFYNNLFYLGWWVLLQTADTFWNITILGIFLLNHQNQKYFIDPWGEIACVTADEFNRCLFYHTGTQWHLVYVMKWNNHLGLKYVCRYSPQ